MSFTDIAHTEAPLEECLDELQELLAALDRYAPSMLAVGLRVHLSALLRALLEGGLCNAEQVRDFIRELQRDALQDFTG